LLPGIWFVLICTLVFAFHPSYVPPNHCLDYSLPVRPSPWQGEIVYPWLAFEFVTLLIVEVVLSRCASAHSPLVPTSVPGIAGIDDMFRGKIVNILQFVSIMQIVLFCSGLPLVVSEPYFMVAITIPLLGFLAVLQLLKSHGLGGKLTNWPWQRKHVA
jgi:hypothetical protein